MPRHPECHVYVFSMRVPQDAAVLLVGRYHGFADAMNARFRLAAAAIQQMQHNLGLELQDGVAEFDGMRTTGKKNKGDRTVMHLAQVFWKKQALFALHKNTTGHLPDRWTDQTCFLPLPDRQTKLGAPGKTCAC